MRKFSAILLIGVFAFSQYARQISYLQCTLLNSVKLPEQQCDCTQQAGFDKQPNEQTPAHKAHFHIRLDEFFPLTDNMELNIYSSLAIRLLSPHSCNECEGHYPSPWQPPNS